MYFAIAPVYYSDIHDECDMMQIVTDIPLYLFLKESVV